MITRIRYKRKGYVLLSPNFVINRNLCVFIQINISSSELHIKCTGDNKSEMVELCTSIKQAKYKARRKLIELGMNFNREFRK